MDDDRIPQTQPSGSLVPPPRVPPTAVATSAPLPPRPPRPSHPRHPASVLPRPKDSGLGGLVNALLDSLDVLGDRIAGIAGVR